MGSVRWKINPDGTVDEIHRVVVYNTIIPLYDSADEYDSDANILGPWRNTQQGTFIFEHCITKPEIAKSYDVGSYQSRIAVIAELTAKKLSEFYLKWGNPCGNN
jgi:hypothetical protein